MESSGNGAQTAGALYLDHLSDEDLALLAGAGRAGGNPADTVARLRSSPGTIEALLSETGVFDAVFGSHGREEPFLRASPFLVFALILRRAAADLRERAFVTEWLGPRQRVPVFDAGDLRDFLDDPLRRLFLAELLASYTHVSSGSFLVHTSKGWRRRRFSELDPVRLAGLLEVVPDSERAGLYRRLGDLALFLTGVFPDHTATRSVSPVAEVRLRRAAGLGAGEASEPSPGQGGPWDTGAVALLELLGRRWYRLASATAPVPTAMLRVVGEVAERFDQARRILNVLTERYLFPFRDRWLSPPGW